jgi:UDP-N-acetylglucosamine acyltransferase
MNVEAIKNVERLFAGGAKPHIGNEVVIGRGNLILPGTIIVGKVFIGDNNIIGPYATIGTPAQHIKYYNEGIDSDNLAIRIGSGNIIREYVTVHAPTVRDTMIGDDCFIMSYSHVSHDTQVGDGVTLTNNAQIAGHTTIMRRATVGLNTSIHQYSSIGAFCMLGMGAIVSKDVPPFLTYTNFKCTKINSIGMMRNGFAAEDVESVRRYYTKNEEPNSKIRAILDEFEGRRCKDRKVCEISVK